MRPCSTKYLTSFQGILHNLAVHRCAFDNHLLPHDIQLARYRAASPLLEPRASTRNHFGVRGQPENYGAINQVSRR